MTRSLPAALVAATLAASTQAPAAEDPVVILHQHLAAADQADAWKRWADDFSHELRTSMGTMFSSRVGSTKVVKGAPYSAEVVTESNQALADGNVISRRTSGAIYRDGQGRTRQETPGEGNARSIFIGDPVAGKHIMLTPGTKRAIEMPLARARTGDAKSSQVVSVQVVRMGEDGDIPVPPIPPSPPLAPGRLQAPLPPMPPMPGMQTMRFENLGRLGKGVTTSMGTKEFDGVKAEGKSTVWTIAAGEIGNRNPINVTSETWYSPELQATVYSRYNDPRTGESIYRLAGIKRGEPAADLFDVPPDYKVRERTRK